MAAPKYIAAFVCGLLFYHLFFSSKVNMAMESVYEVVMKVHPDSYESYVNYIKNTLMKGMLQRPGFQRGMITQMADNDGWKQIMIQYDVTDKAEMHKFFQSGIVKDMIEEQNKHFGDKIQGVSRGIRDVLYSSS